MGRKEREKCNDRSDFRPPRQKEDGGNAVRSFWRAGDNLIFDIQMYPSASANASSRIRNKRRHHSNNPELQIHPQNDVKSEAKSNLVTKGSLSGHSRVETIINSFPQFIRTNLITWAKAVYARVGPMRKEIEYQKELKNILLGKGLEVAMEVPLKFQRQNESNCFLSTVSKRADLIISLPGVVDRVLIECKAKDKVSRQDLEQVIFYQHHFGIQTCYLINFGPDIDVRKLRELKLTK